MRALLLIVLASLSLETFAFRKCPAASFYPSFVGNVTLDNAFDFQFREQYSATLNLAPFFGIAALDSFSVNSNINHNRVDVASTRLVAHVGSEQATTLFPPIVAYAYFDDSSNFNSSGSIDFNNGVYSTAATIFFGSLIEFADLNGNGVYDKSDKIVQEISLTQQSYDYICSSIKDGKVHSDDIVSYNVTTRKSELFPLPGVPYVPFSVQVRTSPVYGVSSHGDVMAPKFAKIDLEVSDFPYKGYNNTNNTYLAISTYFLAAQFNASFDFNMNGQQIDGGNNSNSKLTFAWDSIASSDLGDMIVKASSFGEADVNSFPDYAFKIFFDATLKANLDAKQVIYSFTKPQPKHVYWDPSLGAGPSPKVYVPNNNHGSNDDDTSNPGMWVGIGVGLGVALLLAAAAAIWYMKRKSQASYERQHLVADTTAPLAPGGYQSATESAV